MDFWLKLENLVAPSEIVIDRPRGSTHPKYPDIVYPFDNGYLKYTTSSDDAEIDVCWGSLNGNRLVAVVCTVDLVKRDTEVKLLIDCTDDEIAMIDRFFNTTQYMSGIIIKRDSGYKL